MNALTFTEGGGRRRNEQNRISPSGRVSFLADASVFLFGHAQAVAASHRAQARRHSRYLRALPARYAIPYGSPSLHPSLHLGLRSMRVT